MDFCCLLIDRLKFYFILKEKKNIKTYVWIIVNSGKFKILHRKKFIGNTKLLNRVKKTNLYHLRLKSAWTRTIYWEEEVITIKTIKNKYLTINSHINKKKKPFRNVNWIYFTNFTFGLNMNFHWLLLVGQSLHENRVTTKYRYHNWNDRKRKCFEN